MGWTLDFGDVKTLFNPIFKALDHHPLHELDGLADGDTATLAAWVLAQARPSLPQLVRVDVYETRGCGSIVALPADGPRAPGAPTMPV
jgi:6-pyruvoyltetrahydropterin/6-carboxytetrahydropterin synthase